nr:hypothetical protein [uncultured Flavobacterium sp.]
MKLLKKFTPAVFALLFATLYACDCGDESPTTIYSSSKINTIVTGTVWKVSQYSEANTDKTSNYNGYTFSFTDTVLTASNGNQTATANWSVTDSNPTADLISDLNFTLDFSAPELFSVWSADWQILQKSSTQIKLKNENSSTGAIRYLTFAKN